ncbi:hypothetical protein GCM10020256_15460 [Streptomyces thermocoprophilus]
MTETTLRGTAPRLTDGTGTLHGETLAGRITAAAREFHDRGLRPGDRVLVRGDNSTDYVVALLALMHLDTSLVPVDHRQTADEARLAAAQAGARWMLCDATAPGAFPADRMLHFTGAGSRTAPPAEARPDLAAWFARRDALVLWSSGTTGGPRAS